jgi:hypothetical protein
MKREIVNDNGDGTVTIKDTYEVGDPVFVVVQPERICQVYTPDKPTTSGDLTPPKGYYGENKIEIKFEKKEGEK